MAASTMNQEFVHAERTRVKWFAVIIVGLVLELTGAILLFKGNHTPGLITAFAGIVLWIIARSFGMRKYTEKCARLRVRYGLEMRDAAVPEDVMQFRKSIPLFPLVPKESSPNLPLTMYPLGGHWRGAELTVAEMTLSYQTGADKKQRQFLSGTLAVLPAKGAVSPLLAIYGKPYGGIPLSRWSGMTPVDTGDRGYLMLAKDGTEPDEYLLDAYAAFDKDHKATAILWTAQDCLCAFLPLQFYSGNWTLVKPMPEAAAGVNPLPLLEELPKLLKKIS